MRYFHKMILLIYLKKNVFIDSIVVVAPRRQSPFIYWRTKMVRLSDYKKDYEQTVLGLHLFPEQAGFAIEPDVLLATENQDEEKHLCVVLFEEKPCGAVLVKSTAPLEYELISLMIDKNYQKKGIGKLAMLDLVQKMKNRKARKLSTSISKTNTRAMDFLQRTGFRIKEETNGQLRLEMEIYYD